ncbi:hypothetical protein [Cohnella sp. 56]|uniref:hypothetical protein n=1 Tax=Cohnella sp. 56 TaxID=3113722 RepID=UPI0030E92573
MKKSFIVGFFAGVMMTASVSSFAATSSVVGKKVQGEFTVVVDGAALSQKAVVIDGSSYAPLRSVGDSTGYDVSFEDKTVAFTKKTEVANSTVSENANELTAINQELLALTMKLKIYSEEVNRLETEGRANPDKQKEISKQIEDLNVEYDPIASKLKTLQARRDELQKQINQR